MLDDWFPKLDKYLEENPQTFASMDDRKEIMEMLEEARSRSANIRVASQHVARLPSMNMKWGAVHTGTTKTSMSDGTANVMRVAGYDEAADQPIMELIPKDERPKVRDYKDQIVLNYAAYELPPDQQIQLFLHEIAHNWSVRKVERAGEKLTDEFAEFRLQFGNELRDSAENAKYGDAPARIPFANLISRYGVDVNTKELIAEAYGNVMFRRAMKDTKMPGTDVTYWDRFVELQSKLLGISSLALMAKIIEGPEAANGET
jgi:hypothetical protein